MSIFLFKLNLIYKNACVCCILALMTGKKNIFSKENTFLKFNIKIKSLNPRTHSESCLREKKKMENEQKVKNKIFLFQYSRTINVLVQSLVCSMTSIGNVCYLVGNLPLPH